MFGYAINVTTAFIALTPTSWYLASFSYCDRQRQSLWYLWWPAWRRMLVVLLVLIALSLGQVSVVTPLNGTAPLFRPGAGLRLSQRYRTADRPHRAGDVFIVLGVFLLTRGSVGDVYGTSGQGLVWWSVVRGLIGAAVAYYLSLRGVAATVIERCGVACAASARLAGFWHWTGALVQRAIELLRREARDELSHQSSARNRQPCGGGAGGRHIVR